MAESPSVRCAGEADTVALGERIAGFLRCGDLISLSGPLGAGKTVLVRGIAVGAGADALAVRSPTFVLHHVYNGDRLRVHHLDLYRLGDGADIALLDVEGLLDTGAVVIEWAELSPLGHLAPAVVLIDIEADGARRVTLRERGGTGIAAAWQQQAETR